MPFDFLAGAGRNLLENYLQPALSTVGEYSNALINNLFPQKMISPLPRQVTAQPLPTNAVPDERTLIARQIAAGTYQPTATPTPTSIPTPTPEPANQRYADRTYYFESNLYDALQQVEDEYLRLLLSALAAQESSGGRQVVGDEGLAFGPYHIRSDIRGISPEQASDPYWATQYALSELEKYINRGLTPEQALRRWNWNSGYVPGTSPRYDVELPLMATTSSFLRGR